MSRLAIKTRALTDSEKDYRGVESLVKLLETAAWVDSPDGGSRVTVNYGSVQPGPDDLNAPWFRTRSDGSSVGIFAPDGSGGWGQIAGFLTNELRRIGPFNITSDILPDGWYLANGTNGTLDLTAEFDDTGVGYGDPQFKWVWIQYLG